MSFNVDASNILILIVTIIISIVTYQRWKKDRSLRIVQNIMKGLHSRENFKSDKTWGFALLNELELLGCLVKNKDIHYKLVKNYLNKMIPESYQFFSESKIFSKEFLKPENYQDFKELHSKIIA